MGRKKVWLGGVAAAGVAAAAIAGGAVFLLGSSEPAAVALDQAVAAASAASGAGAVQASATGADAELAGTWTVVDGSSFVGYRVEEELAGFGASTAVGRTSAVDGSLTFDGERITAVNIEADVSQLQSDQSRRDMALRQQALETAKYPTATFALTSPIAVDGAPGDGASIETTATGALTVHGVTKTVSIPLHGQLVGGQVVVVGSTEIAFADFGIAQPRAAAVLSVADRATLELQLVFAQA
jgi:polyisoprenoid-binding protein YceI